jgi:hypothetical protein
MKTKWVWVIGTVVALGVVGVAVALGVQSYQHKHRLAAFQMLIREGSGQAEASLGMISAKGFAMKMVEPECERFAQAQRDFIAKVAAANMSDAPEVQREYVALLNAEEDLMGTIGAVENNGLKWLSDSGGSILGEVSRADACNQGRYFKDQIPTFMENMKNVSILEHNFQATCSKHGLAYEPVFSKYQEHFAEHFNPHFLFDS